MEGCLVSTPRGGGSEEEGASSQGGGTRKCQFELCDNIIMMGVVTDDGQACMCVSDDFESHLAGARRNKQIIEKQIFQT